VLAILREMREDLALPEGERPDRTVALVRTLTDDATTERRLGPAVRALLGAIDAAPLT